MLSRYIFSHSSQLSRSSWIRSRSDFDLSSAASIEISIDVSEVDTLELELLESDVPGSEELESEFESMRDISAVLGPFALALDSQHSIYSRACSLYASSSSKTFRFSSSSSNASSFRD